MTALLLSDRYSLDERIAVGGMGEVWRATDTVLDRTVAVKTLKPEYAEDDDFRARFRAEARHAGRLSHPGIASVYDFGETGAGAYLVMELVDGEPLSAVLRRQGALPADQVLDVVAQTAAALQAAHDGGVVHRDVKPGNLLVRPDGVVKVTDFGIASATDAVPLTRTGEVVGTAYYLSPEQARGDGAGPRSDLYALGVVAYECLAGVRPFPGEQPVAVLLAHLQTPPPPLPASVPAPVAALVMGLLAKDPDERPSSAGDLAAEATRLRSGGPAQTRALTVVSPVVAGPPVAGAPVLSGAGVPLSQRIPTRADPPSRADPPTRVDTPTRLDTPSRLDTPGATRPGQRRAVRAIAVLLAVLAVGLGLRSALAGESVLVPAARGTEQQAAQAVRDAGLVPTTRREPDAKVPAGTVLALEPAAGTEVDEGAAVVVVVSAGPPSVRVTAEDLVGKPASAARDSLRAAGLVPRLVLDGRGTPVGTVASVEPVGDLAAGSSVVLHVVPEPRSAPAGDGKDDDDEGDRGKGKGKD